MQPEDFNKFIEGRSGIVSDLDELHGILDYLAHETVTDEAG